MKKARKGDFISCNKPSIFDVDSSEFHPPFYPYQLDGPDPLTLHLELQRQITAAKQKTNNPSVPRDRSNYQNQRQSSSQSSSSSSSFSDSWEVNTLNFRLIQEEVDVMISKGTLPQPLSPPRMVLEFLSSLEIGFALKILDIYASKVSRGALIGDQIMFVKNLVKAEMDS